MSSHADEEMLDIGAEATEFAKTTGQGSTAVLSLRLSRHEFAKIEAMSDTLGRSLSDVVREAIRAYVDQRSPIPLINPSKDFNYIVPGAQLSNSTTLNAPVLTERQPV